MKKTTIDLFKQVYLTIKAQHMQINAIKKDLKSLEDKCEKLEKQQK